MKNGFSFIALADTQISCRSHLDEPKKNYNRFQEHVQYFEFVKDYITKNNVGLVVHAGDVFDDSNPENPALNLFSGFVHWVTKIRDIDFLICLGNHDGNRADNPIEHLSLIGADSKRSTKVAISPFFVNYPSASGHLSLNFISYDWQDYKAGLSFPPDDRIKDGVNILVAHVPILGSYMNPQYKPKDAGLVGNGKKWGMMLLGHYHLHQNLSHLLKTESCYIGSSIKDDFGEIGQVKGFVHVSIQDDGKVKWKHVSYPDVQFVQIDLKASEGFDHIISKVLDPIGPESPRIIVKLRIEFTDREQLASWDQQKGEVIKGLYKEEKVLKVISDPCFALKNVVRSREYNPAKDDRELSMAYLKSEKNPTADDEKLYKKALQELLK